MEAVVILATTPTLKHAEKISRTLVEKKLAACVSVVGNVRSTFRWEGKITTEKECLMIIKTRKELFNAAAEHIRKQHPYQVPEIIASPIIAGSKPYLTWLEESTKSPEG